MGICSAKYFFHLFGLVVDSISYVCHRLSFCSLTVTITRFQIPDVCVRSRHPPSSLLGGRWPTGSARCTSTSQLLDFSGTHCTEHTAQLQLYCERFILHNTHTLHEKSTLQASMSLTQEGCDSDPQRRQIKRQRGESSNYDLYMKNNNDITTTQERWRRCCSDEGRDTSACGGPAIW